MIYFARKIYALRDTPAMVRLIGWILPYRLYLILLIHLFIFAVSYISSLFLLRGGLEEEFGQVLGSTLPLLLLVRGAIFYRYDLYQGLWRYVSFQDLLNILRATFISSAIFVAMGIAWEPASVPESVYVLDTIFCIVLAGGTRAIVRNLRENLFPGISRKEQNSILVIGPLKHVQPLVKELIDNPHALYNPVAIVDPTKKSAMGRMRLMDLPVFSLEEAALRNGRLRGLKAAVLCWPDAARRERDSVIDFLKPLETPFKTIPSMDDLVAGKVQISDIRDVEIEDLLERKPVWIQMDRIRHQLQKKVVLVSGGGGSIGSELCRQIASFAPGKLVVVERSEASLYDLQLEIRGRFPQIPLYASISTINDYEGLVGLMKEQGVEVVFHAAAYKHVPLMEPVPVESAYNNVLGTYNLAQASLAAGVKRFVMISTDKAVNPTNVMGVTKRIAEMVVQSYNGGTATKFMVVRFGNVMGSSGSVIPLFKKQILAGGPVTVTHPEIERFFMTIPEAVQLVLQAGAMGKGGEIFVLDMGEPVKILHLAEKLIMLSGKRPYRDVNVTFTGLRPGEKMYEELFNRCEQEVGTEHAQIRMAISPVEDPKPMKDHVEEIRRLVRARDDEGLRRKFKELVPGYSCGQEG